MMTERDIQEERHATILGCCVSEIGSAEDWPEYAGCGWHNGPPEWCERDYPDRFDREYRTVLYPNVPYGIPSDPSGWVRVATFNVGEPDCPGCGAGTENESERDGCPICEGSGVVYEGEGAIVVYARTRDEHEEIQICADCLVYLANGDLPEGRPDLPSEIDDNWPSNEWEVFPGTAEGSFSWYACECCGSTLGGDRYDATAVARVSIGRPFKP